MDLERGDGIRMIKEPKPDSINIRLAGDIEVAILNRRRLTRETLINNNQ